MNWFFVCLRVAFGLIFIFASLGKIADPGAFAVVIARYQLLPPELVNLTAITLPWVEALCGLALVFGVFARGAALVLTGLMLVFINALVANMVRGVNIACGCFDLDPDAKANMTLAALRDAGLLLMALIVLGREHFLFKSQSAHFTVRFNGRR